MTPLHPTLQTIFQGGVLLTGLWLAGRLLRRTPDFLHPESGESRRLLQRAWPRGETAGVFALLLLLYLLASGSGAFFYEEQQAAVQIIAAITINTTLLSFIAFRMRRRGLPWDTAFGLGRNRFQEMAKAPLFYLAWFPILAISSAIVEQIVRRFTGTDPSLQQVAVQMMTENGWVLAAYLFTAVLLAPFFEEILFRGILFPFFARQTSPLAGAVLTSLFFAFSHFHLPSVPPLFLLSLALCWAYWKTGSLWPAIGMHLIQNTLAIIHLLWFQSPP